MKLWFPGPLNPHLKFFLGESYEISTKSDADFIFYHDLLTSDKNIPKMLDTISATYKQSSIRVIVLILDDYELQYTYFENLVLLRFSARKSLLAENEIVVPYLFECRETPFSPCIENQNTLSIGFCGYAAPRQKVLTFFENAESVHADFIKRKSFWGGRPHDKKLINEFYANMRRNPFNLSPRGNGNFSMRFYQTLSAGRIPVLIDTDIQLPLDNLIDWKKIIVFGTGELDCIAKMKVIVGNSEVVNRQEFASVTFHNYLSNQTYFKHLALSVMEKFGNR